MFIMFSVGLLCAVFLIAGLFGLACRNRDIDSMWIVSDDTMLCLIAPTIILLTALGIISLGQRLTQGGLAEVSIEAWIGTAVIVAASVGIWRLLAPRIRGYRRKSGSAPSESTQARN